MGKVEDVSKKLADAFTKHDIEALTKLYASDTVAYDPMYPEPLRGKDATRKDAAIFLRGFPDMRFEVLTVIEKDDRNGAVEVRLSGTHTGPLEGPTGQDIPPTNKRVEMKAGTFVRLNQSGEIAEERRYYDVAGLMRQLGLMPEPAEEPAAARR